MENQPTPANQPDSYITLALCIAGVYALASIALSIHFATRFETSTLSVFRLAVSTLSGMSLGAAMVAAIIVARKVVPTRLAKRNEPPANDLL